MPYLFILLFRVQHSARPSCSINMDGASQKTPHIPAPSPMFLSRGEDLANGSPCGPLKVTGSTTQEKVATLQSFSKPPHDARARKGMEGAQSTNALLSSLQPETFISQTQYLRWAPTTRGGHALCCVWRMLRDPRAQRKRRGKQQF